MTLLSCGTNSWVRSFYPIRLIVSEVPLMPLGGGSSLYPRVHWCLWGGEFIRCSIDSLWGWEFIRCSIDSLWGWEFIRCFIDSLWGGEFIRCSIPLLPRLSFQPSNSKTSFYSKKSFKNPYFPDQFFSTMIQTQHKNPLLPRPILQHNDSNTTHPYFPDQFFSLWFK